MQNQDSINSHDNTNKSQNIDAEKMIYNELLKYLNRKTEKTA